MISDTLFWMHPLMQIVAAVLGVWAMWQGWKRFQMTHGKKVIFPWKQHVKLGSWALVLWILGSLGFYVTHEMFGETHITGTHAFLTWPIIALSIAGLVSGYVMNRYKKKRTTLPLVHGALNVLLLILIGIQCFTGAELWKTFS